MRLERLQLRGFSKAFPDLVDLNLRDVAPGLVAIVGHNGAGKTTLIEAMAPAPIYRQLPARDGDDPVVYATTRDAFIDLEYSIEGRGAFRSRLNMDGPKRATDAVLEAVLPDGTRATLTDGKRSTYNALIAERFPSFDLFINSCFAGQGRGDEFTKAKPSARKDLFVEFLALQHLLVMAKTAAESAELCADARLRLEVQVEQLRQASAPALLEAVDRDAKELQTRGGAAELRKVELAARIKDLQARADVLADQVAAFAAATQRLDALKTNLAGRRAERAQIDEQRQTAADALTGDLKRIEASNWHNLTDAAAARDRDTDRIAETRDRELAEVAKRIAGNQEIQAKADAIRGAVAAIADLDAQLPRVRELLVVAHADHRRNAEELRAIERQLADLKPVDQQLTRAKTDAGLLSSVPCGGAGEYAACQFLRNAAAAQARISDLEVTLRPKADLADAIARLTLSGDVIAQTVTTLQKSVSDLEARKTEHQKLAQYDVPLAESTARIASLTAARDKAHTDAQQRLADVITRYADTCTRADTTASQLVTEAQERHDTRIAQLVAQASMLDDLVAHLLADVDMASADLVVTTEGNAQAVVLQRDLAGARAEWDVVIATLATVAGQREELERRRVTLQATRVQCADVERRLKAIETELLEWRDLAKALGKGGLPDLEIDAAGPTISAICNDLLLSCFGPRFTLEIVTQVQKADGSGMKDEFTVRVFDNEANAWRDDISKLSGGEKVVVQEALMCAIALFVNERSPMPIRTLWRDETGAALDPQNAIRYVEMLRKVRELGQFHHVFFISHNPAAAALADVQIQVGDGTARLVHPPFSEAA